MRLISTKVSLIHIQLASTTPLQKKELPKWQIEIQMIFPLRRGSNSYIRCRRRIGMMCPRGKWSRIRFLSASISTKVAALLFKMLSCEKGGQTVTKTRRTVECKRRVHGRHPRPATWHDVVSLTTIGVGVVRWYILLAVREHTHLHSRIAMALFPSLGWSLEKTER